DVWYSVAYHLIGYYFLIFSVYRTTPRQIFPLSLHDALPISSCSGFVSGSDVVAACPTDTTGRASTYATTTNAAHSSGPLPKPRAARPSRPVAPSSEAATSAVSAGGAAGRAASLPVRPLRARPVREGSVSNRPATRTSTASTAVVAASHTGTIASQPRVPGCGVV